MQFAISDAAAIAFAHGFYAAIANGRAVDEAARVGRISVMASPEGTLEWATPALYVRGGSTRLFKLAALPRPPAAVPVQEAVPAPAPAPSPVPAPESGPVPASTPARDTQLQAERARQAQLRALYVQASAELRTRRFEQAAELFDDLLTLEPGYRDAQALRSSALHRHELAEQYRHAREAEDAQDWGAAAEAYALLQGEADFPDAAERRRDCERRQRVAELQSELRYHAHGGSWQAVLDVAVELEAVDPGAADPEGLATAARAELQLAKERAARDRAEQDRAAREEAARARAAEERAARENAAREKAQQPVRGPEKPPTVHPTGLPAEPERRPAADWNRPVGFTGGLLLVVAGLLGAFGAADYYWYVYKIESDAFVLVASLGLLIPAALLTMAAAGFPVRSIAGRLALLGAALASFILGWGGLARMPAGPAVFLTVGQCAAAVLLAIACFAGPAPRRIAGWVLSASLASVAFVWSETNTEAFQAAYMLALALSGVLAAWVSRPWKRPGKERNTP
jgi:hypothetical protein